MRKYILTKENFGSSTQIAKVFKTDDYEFNVEFDRDADAYYISFVNNDDEDIELTYNTNSEFEWLDEIPENSDEIEDILDNIIANFNNDDIINKGDGEQDIDSEF